MADVEDRRSAVPRHDFPNVLDEHLERTPLMDAVLDENTDIVASLLEHGANPNMSGPEEPQTALHFAAGRQNAEIFGLLIAAGADPSSRAAFRGGNWTPLDMIEPARQAEFAALIEQGGN